jgi:hypothetical protein
LLPQDTFTGAVTATVAIAITNLHSNLLMYTPNKVVNYVDEGAAVEGQVPLKTIEADERLHQPGVVKVFNVYDDITSVKQWTMWQLKTFNWLNLGVVILLLVNLQELKTQSANQNTQLKEINAKSRYLEHRQTLIEDIKVLVEENAAAVAGALYIFKNSTLPDALTALKTAHQESLVAAQEYITEKRANVTNALQENLVTAQEYITQKQASVTTAIDVKHRAVNATLHTIQATFSQFATPTVSPFTSEGASGFYVPPTSPAPRYLRIRMVGGGGGGIATTNAAVPPSGAGTASVFSSGAGILLNAGGGSGVICSDSGGAGGTTTASGVPFVIQIAGGGGASGGSPIANNAFGAAGGNSYYGGGGRGSISDGFSGSAGTGGGGGAGGCPSTATGVNCWIGGGGGAGGYIEAVIPAPFATSYSYTVGSGGAGGTTNNNVGYPGGKGAGGSIFVEEYYW